MHQTSPISRSLQSLGQHAPFVQHRHLARDASRRTPCRARPRPANACRRATGTARRCARSPRRSCRRPARRAAAACGSCISSMPISSHCFWPCDSRPAGASRCVAAGGSARASRRCGRAARRSRRDEQRARARRLSAFSASSRFSNTVWLLEHRRLLELAADAGVRDLGFRAGASGRWSGRRTRVPASGRVLPVMTSIIVVLPAPLGPMMQRSSPASIVERQVVQRLEAVEADGDVFEVEDARRARRRPRRRRQRGR